MKKAMLLGLVLTAFAFGPSMAEAAKNSRTVVVYQPGYGYVEARPAKKGPIARLWELEKRKNAWLKRTFLRR